MKKLIIIAGAAGEIGSGYAKAISEKNTDVIAVVRNKKLSFISPFIKEVLCHLDDEKSIDRARRFSKSLESLPEVILNRIKSHVREARNAALQMKIPLWKL